VSGQLFRLVLSLQESSRPLSGHHRHGGGSSGLQPRKSQAGYVGAQLNHPDRGLHLGCRHRPGVLREEFPPRSLAGRREAARAAASGLGAGWPGGDRTISAPDQAARRGHSPGRLGSDLGREGSPAVTGSCGDVCPGGAKIPREPRTIRIGLFPEPPDTTLCPSLGLPTRPTGA
jgi:hypothetical protein